MKRAIVVALGTGAIITSAAALSIGNAWNKPGSLARSEFEQARSEWTAREAQRARIDERYQALRAECDALGGGKRDRCLISAQAYRGRALMHAQAPYETR
jgi:hypothetical protein